MDTIKRYFHKLAVGAAVSLLTISTSLSDDIDVYVAPPPEATVGETLVVFTLDVRPNVMASTVCTNNECDALFAEVQMSDQLNADGSTSFFLMLVAVLKKVLRDIDSHKIKVALMIPHADTTGGNKQCVGDQGASGPQCSNGAYVLSAFKSTGDNPDTAANEALELDLFFEKMESIPLKDGGNWSHPYQIKELFFEMFRYITAQRVYNGRNGLDNFGTGNVNACNINVAGDTESVFPGNDTRPAHNEQFPEGGEDCPIDGNIVNPVAELIWDPTSQKNNAEGQPQYQNTLDNAEHCTSIFSVNVTFANSSQDNDSNDAIETDFGFRPANSSKGEDQVLEHLANTDLSPDPQSDTDSGLVGQQNITSYFVTRAGGTANRANDWAQAGGTGSALVFEDDPNELVRLLSGLFNEIQGVSTTFVAASVPANVFNRAETLSEVFLAIFDPDENSRPFWVGNVKKLTTTTITETVFEDTDGDGVDEEISEERKILVDVLEADKAEPNSAINPLDGRIRSGALTYWTQTGSGNEYLPAPTTAEDELEFEEGTDGRKVDRGGAGQVKPGYLDTGSPGEVNSTSNTTMSGPRKVFTEPDTATNGLPSETLVDLDAASLSDTVAVDLLTDSRPYPGGGGVEYGDFLFQTVMEDDCSTCTDYSAASTSDQETAQLRVSNLVRFARGLDVNLNTALDVTNGKRAWWQSDPLHTRPLALNYGARPGYTNDRSDIRVVLGGNDGLIQMTRDGRKSDDSEDGVEGWAFLPREFVPLQKRLMQGDVGLYDPGRPDVDGHKPLHPYAMDGAPTALVIDNNLDGTIDTGDGDQVYLFMGQRRGGKRYYALDISDPDNPKYLWSIGKNDAGGDFAEMGMSFSLTRAGIIEVDEGGTLKNRPFLAFSGGYNGDDGGDGAGDLGKDSRVKNHNSGTEILGTDDDEGNALFIVNALTGELIWKAVGTTDSTASYDSSALAYKHPDLVDSVASSPTVVDATGNGRIDRVYFPDTGGNVWRMDASSADRSNWKITRLFSAGRHFQADNTNDRRFFNAPDVVFASDETGDFDAVILASGDRAHPLGVVAENWIYMIKDRHTDGPVPGDLTEPILTHDDLADLTDNCLQADPEDFSSCTDTSAATNIANGWKVQLEQCEAGGTDPNCGEKSMASPLTIEGEIFLTSYLPVLDTIVSDTPSTCGTKEGGGLFYALDLQTAAGVLDFDPSNNTGGVKTPDRFDRLSSPGIPPEVVAISPGELMRPDLEIQKTKGRPSSKTFWYERRFR